MHDFCVTILYGMLLLGGGVTEYMKQESVISFVGGVVTGYKSKQDIGLIYSYSALFIILSGYSSLKAFEHKKNSSIAMVVQTVVAAALTLVMGHHYFIGKRYFMTGKIMLAGLVALISALMTCFYVCNIATGGNIIPLKDE